MCVYFCVCLCVSVCGLSVYFSNRGDCDVFYTPSHIKVLLKYLKQNYATILKSYKRKCFAADVVHLFCFNFHQCPDGHPFTSCKSNL